MNSRVEREPAEYLSTHLRPAFEQDSTKVVHVFKNTEFVPDYGWSQVRGSTPFDIANQLIRVDLTAKEKWS